MKVTVYLSPENLKDMLEGNIFIGRFLPPYINNCVEVEIDLKKTLG